MSQGFFREQLLPRPIKRVLIEYDGPQLAIRNDGETMYLSGVCDENERGPVWIDVPMSELEWVALARGAVATRDVFLKRTAIYMQRDWQGVQLYGYPAPEDGIPDDNLPAPGALLPTDIREALAEEAEETAEPLHEPRAVRLAGRSGLVSFSDLGAIAQRFQSYVSGFLADYGRAAKQSLALMREHAVVYANAIAPGSVVLVADPVSVPLFDAAMEAFRDITARSVDAPNEVKHLVHGRIHTRKSYEALLREIENREVELLAETPSTLLFIGPSIAARARALVRRQRLPDAEENSVVGWFDGFAKVARKFEFRTLDGELISGSVATSVLEGRTAPPIIQVGSDAKYRITYTTRFVDSPAGDKDTISEDELTHVELPPTKPPSGEYVQAIRR